MRKLEELVSVVVISGPEKETAADWTTDRRATFTRQGCHVQDLGLGPFC